MRGIKLTVKFNNDQLNDYYIQEHQLGFKVIEPAAISVRTFHLTLFTIRYVVIVAFAHNMNIIQSW